MIDAIDLGAALIILASVCVASLLAICVIAVVSAVYPPKVEYDR